MRPFPVIRAIERSLLHPALAGMASLIAVDCPAECLVLADQAQIAALISHLLVNASEAVRQIADGRAPVIRVAARRQGDRVLVTVHDNGIGIPPINLPRVFDPFFTTKDASDGMGLGLTMCRSMVMQHGGRIQMRSEYGRWSEAVFDLPLAP